MTWRCHDCFGSPVFCTPCIQEFHQMHPFHRVSRWNENCFTPSSLSNAGVTLNLGHGGRICPVYQRLQRTAADHPTSPHSATRKSPDKPADTVTSLPPPDRAGSCSARDSVTNSEQSDADLPHNNSTPLVVCSQAQGNCSQITSSIFDQFLSQTGMHSSTPSTHLARFWEAEGFAPYEMNTPVALPSQIAQTDLQTSPENVAVDVADDPFFANESDREEEWKDVKAGGLPLKVKRDNRKYDKFHCPLLTVVDTSGIHEMRLRFCQCQSLKLNPLQTQLMDMGLYSASSKRTRTVFTFKVLHHFDITNLEGKTTAWQYYCTLKRLSSNVFINTVPDRYRELMRALRQWRDLSSRRRAGVPLEPGLELKPGELALFCPACPQPGINLPDGWQKDKEQ